MTKKKEKMWNIPQFSMVIIGTKKAYKFVLVPISEEKDNEIRQKFLTEEAFIVDIGDYRIRDIDIVMYGDAHKNSKKIENKIADVVTSNSLVVPHPIDAENLMQGKKVLTGVDVVRFYEYQLLVLGKPKYTLIFKC